MKKRNWEIMMSAAALAMARMGEKQLPRWKMQVEVKMGLLLMG